MNGVNCEKKATVIQSEIYLVWSGMEVLILKRINKINAPTNSYSLCMIKERNGINTDIKKQQKFKVKPTH